MENNINVELTEGRIWVTVDKVTVGFLNDHFLKLLNWEDEKAYAEELLRRKEMPTTA